MTRKNNFLLSRASIAKCLASYSVENIGNTNTHPTHLQGGGGGPDLRTQDLWEGGGGGGGGGGISNFY